METTALILQPAGVPKRPFKLRIIRHYCGTSLHALRIVFENQKIFKVYKKYPRLNVDGHCGRGELCHCFDEAIETLDPLLVYDLVSDPYETNPLPIDNDW